MHYSTGYFQSPDIFANQVVFTSDNDLWKLDLSHSQRAHRLTNFTDSYPLNARFSPDGTKIAFTRIGKGHNDVYQIDAQGGLTHRLTYFGDCSLLGWEDDNHILVNTSHEHFHRAMASIYKINLQTLQWQKVEVGPARAYLKDSKGNQIIGRFLGDLARWKRYRGGTAGSLWCDNKGNGKFRQILKNLKANLTSPRLINDRLYFLSDHEGVANIYSSRVNGGGIKRHTDQEEFYIRSFNYHEEKIIYACGADIFKLDLQTGNEEKIKIEFLTGAQSAISRFVDTEDNLQNYHVNEDASRLCILSRGKLFFMPPWSGAPQQLGDDSARYRLPQFHRIKKKNYLYAIKIDSDACEKLVRFNLETLEETLLIQEDFGKAWSYILQPKKETLYLSNNRNKLFEFTSKGLKEVDSNSSYHINGFSFSHCGRYLAYNCHYDELRAGIKIYDTKEKKGRFLFEPVLRDANAVFSPCGRFLAFIGVREFHPNFNEARYDFAFTNATRPYIVNLQSLDEHPFKRHLDFETDNDEDEEEDKDKKNCFIDFENIENRITALPVSFGGHNSLYFVDEKLFFSKYHNTPINPFNGDWYGDSQCDLYCYDFKKNSSKSYMSDFVDAQLSANRKYLLIETEEQLRLCAVDSKPSDGEGLHKKDGWIDLERIKYKHNLKQEWQQMYDEAWLLQKENFWTEDMSKIDWENVYFKYLPLLERIHTREEFSDLVWEMQGELGTSHCYEFGGDYHEINGVNRPSHLGAFLRFNEAHHCYEVMQINQGSSWQKHEQSPLAIPGVEMSTGDRIFSMNGSFFENSSDIYEKMEGMGNQSVSLLIQRVGEKEKELITTQLTSSSMFANYRNWVESNKRYVHEKTQGKIGYIHIPNMSLWGCSEFYRHFYAEVRHEGLIVDVRYNGGGNLSEKILKEISQRTLGFDNSRHFGKYRYPSLSVPGPIIALTNELAGSDGDIFSHAFKMMKLGKLIGKRTWGGVVGIWPRFDLNDGSSVSQPEFSFWFKDVGYKVENYGVDPDIEVEITPEDWKNGNDPQLDSAINEVLKDLRKNPPLNSRLTEKSKPNLRPGRLPRRN